MTERDKLIMENVRRMYRGEAEEYQIISPEIVWHVPGHNPVSGLYQGYKEYTEVMPSRMAPLTQWDFTVETIMVNGDYVMTSIHLQGERKGKKIDTRGGHLMRVDEQGRIVEGWGFTEKQDELDEFFSA